MNVSARTPTNRANTAIPAAARMIRYCPGK
jgi:hypothetical protein